MNILVIRFSSLGDLVTLEPTFRAIRYFFGDANIFFLTTSIGKSLYQDSDYFDEYVMYKNIYSRNELLKNKKFDLVINLQCNKPSHFISILLNKKIYVNKSHSLLHKIFGLKAKSKTIKQIIESTKLIHQDVVNKYFEDKETINLPIKKELFFDRDINKKYIAISTGTSERWLSKKWGVHNYLSLIQKLIENNYKIVLVGSNLEIEDEKFIIKNFPENEILSYVNKTSLTQLKNLLSQVDLYIGNDSGPAHIAAGVGTNTITIFGSTGVKHCVKFMPYKGNHEYLKPKENIECHPCYKTKCPTNMECMSSIEINEVLLKVKEMLNSKS